MNFIDVQSFLKSWGLFPGNEDTGTLNPEVIARGINRACYFKMLAEAEHAHGNKFSYFVARAVEATDDSFYLPDDTWSELQSSWETYSDMP